MTWDTDLCLPNTKQFRHFERENTKIVIALKKEIASLNQEHRYKLWHLDHDRKQFEKNHTILSGKKQKKTFERNRIKNERNLTTASLDSYISRWLTTGFHDNKNKSLVVEDTDEKEAKKRSGDNLLVPECVNRADDKINNDIVPRKDSSGSVKHTGVPVELPLTYVNGSSTGTPVIRHNSATQSSGSVLPIIVVSPVKEGSVVSQRASDTFVMKADEVDTEHSSADIPRKFNESPRNSIVISRKLSIDVPPRLRSTSLPVISHSARFLIDPAQKRDRSCSLDASRLLHIRQDSDSHQIIQNSMRTSNGVSKSKVIGDLSRGIMYRDLDERQDTVISEEQWNEVRKCRYLRGHDPSP